VGWVELEATHVERDLDSLASHEVFRGVRPMIQDIADDDWMLRPSIGRGLRALTQRHLTFDALVLPRHLPRLIRLMERHPDLSVVVDHAAKPPIGTGEFESWAAEISRLAHETTACCKLSGLVTEAADDWTEADLRPYVAHLLKCFGTGRLLWGSDWPVVNLAGGFERWRRASVALLGHLNDSETAAVFGQNAERFYALGPAVRHPGLPINRRGPDG
jgi:L-fuconolactonase